MWYQRLTQIFKIKDLRSRILFIFGIFALARLMANIPIPGIDLERLRMFMDQFQSFKLLGAFTGGSMDNMSVAMLGLGPYITAIIILQLLTMIFPSLERMYKEEGEAGRSKFNQYARIASIPLAALQGYAMLVLLTRQNVAHFDSPIILFAALATVTSASLLLMWLGELISEKGIGNGVSLLIFAGIISSFPTSLRQIIFDWDPTKTLSYILFMIASVAIIAGVVLINESRRNIPVSYAKRVRGNKMFGGVSTYLPLNINPAGVIPIIFALSILLFPSMIASFLGGYSGFVGQAATAVNNFFNNQLFYGIAYFILVVLFTYFYTAVTFDPKNIASNLQKMGGFVPGIRPGTPTATYMYYILNRVLLVGAVFLGLIAVMPSIIGAATQVNTFSFMVGGTSLLIAVSVILETARQINAQLQMREYETF
ncbi:MAG TPA: preprotein translocase subunit SecY [Candidatus Paceibacterota bacterium]|nr:preprotein translocase subunit SecY [Candidatus Pacearchaeota archaeon]HRZ50966.1 preprotein translocase subunit SecY [Candidatus Paceibacterota bacterium]HSA36687.1 preprotein translocase subunit SecY [Candidatus Paceibacterota bacterium]